MVLSLIVAVDREMCIGKDNQIPWHLPNDLKYFKRVTTGNTIIMGRKTFDSLGRPLPNRVNIVITRDKSFIAPEGVVICHSLDEAIEAASREGKEEVFVIGGGTIYKEALPKANRLYITFVDTIVGEGDTFFPKVNFTQWREISKEQGLLDDKNTINHEFCVFEK